MTCRCFSAEFAYCEADITFFAARHNEDTRQWLFEDFDKWFSDPGDSRAYVLLGDAGIGKSVIAGALTQRARNKGKDALVAKLSISSAGRTFLSDHSDMGTGSRWSFQKRENHDEPMDWNYTEALIQSGMICLGSTFAKG